LEGIFDWFGGQKSAISCVFWIFRVWRSIFIEKSQFFEDFDKTKANLDCKIDKIGGVPTNFEVFWGFFEKKRDFLLELKKSRDFLYKLVFFDIFGVFY